MPNFYDLEKIYKTKFKENIFLFKTKQKSIENIENIDNFVVEKIDKEDYSIIKPKRNISIFSHQCQYCQKTIIKNIDKEHYLRYECCYQCFILKEENR